MIETCTLTRRLLPLVFLPPWQHDWHWLRWLEAVHLGLYISGQRRSDFKSPVGHPGKEF